MLLIDFLKRELTAYLLLGSHLIRDGVPLLRPKLHIFFRGLWDLSRCTNISCGALIQDGQDICNVCGHKAIKLEICRNCGQDYWKAGVEIDDFNILNVQDEKIYSATDNLNNFRMTTEQKILMEDEGDDWASEIQFNQVNLCSKCGILTDHKKCPLCKEDTRNITIFPPTMFKCPSCGGGSKKREVVTSVVMGAAFGVANIVTTTLSNLEKDERKTLIFSDNRQDAAYQAGYMINQLIITRCFIQSVN